MPETEEKSYANEIAIPWKKSALPNFQIYTMYVNRKDILQNALNALGKYQQQTVVLDNSPAQDLTLEGFPGEIIRPQVPLFCNQSYTLILRLAQQCKQPYFFLMHSDALASEEMIPRMLAMAAEQDRSGRRWGYLFTNYDILCLAKTEAIKDFAWDPYLPLYYTDVDYYRRLKLAGVEIIESGLPVGHQEGGSTSLQAETSLQAFVQSNYFGWRDYYKLKWGGERGQECFDQPFQGVTVTGSARGQTQQGMNRPQEQSGTDVPVPSQNTPDIPSHSPSPSPAPGTITVTLNGSRTRAAQGVSERRDTHAAGLERLAQVFAFPDTPPAVKACDHGWFQNETAQALAQHLPPHTRVILELGSWLGRSTRFLADRAPQATVIAVDHWCGSREHHVQDPQMQELLPVLYETFLVNCWEYRERIVPIRMTTPMGMERVAQEGVLPDLIYVDASHDYESVRQDVETALRLFPGAVLVGDDWFDKQVQQAVVEIVQARRLEARFGANITSWWIECARR